MIAEFSKEIKRAVWECESLKSPCPDRIHFSFIKQFLEVIKVDFHRFLTEFYASGRLVCVANNVFIVLIPKCDN